jgi:hypothetical protein
MWELQRIETLSDLGRAAGAAQRIDVLADALRAGSLLAAAITMTLLLRANRIGAMARLPDRPLDPSIPMFPEFCKSFRRRGPAPERAPPVHPHFPTRWARPRSARSRSTACRCWHQF